MKQLIRKILKEQDEVINVPGLDFFDDDWEELLRFTKGRKFRVRGDLDLKYICPETLGNLISVDGDLDLYGCKNLPSLGSLERVDGDLYLGYCQNLTSLGNLEYIGIDFYLPKCYDLTSLGSLEHVGGDFYSPKCYNLSSLGSLKYVGGNLNLSYTPIADMYSEREIREMVEVKGDIYFR
jgi:hypothetical protein